MMEWVLTTGFLEQVFRNGEQVRRDIRNRAREWALRYGRAGG
jgi:hypothetical protein